MKQMKTIKFPDNPETYEIVDAEAREDIKKSFKQIWNVPAGGSYVGWIQLIKLPPASNGTLDIKPFIFNIYRNYIDPASESYTLSIHAVQDIASITQLSGNYKERIIEKFRISKKNDNMYYLEMYVNTSYATYTNECHCCVSDYYSFNGQLISTVSTETPSSVLCELTTGAGFYSTDPIVANSDTDYNFSRVRNISAGTADLTAGTSTLANGSIYLVYE